MAKTSKKRPTKAHTVVFQAESGWESWSFEREADAHAKIRAILKAEGVEARGPASIERLCEKFNAEKDCVLLHFASKILPPGSIS